MSVFKKKTDIFTPENRSELHFASSIEWKLPQKKKIVNVSLPRIRGRWRR